MTMRLRLSSLLFVLALVLAAALVAQLPVVRGETRMNRPPEDLLRLHIIANSNSDRDQALKRLVRDVIVDVASRDLGTTADAPATRRYFVANSDRLRELAETALRENGNSDPVRIDIGNHWFPEKSYQGAVVPAGNYESVRVIIGEGAGHNWWCVVFPPLCFSVEGGEVRSVEVVDPQPGLVDEEQLESVHYEIRLKTTEWLQKIRCILPPQIHFGAIRGKCGLKATAQSDSTAAPADDRSPLRNLSN